jgi:hypothetical protein
MYLIMWAVWAAGLVMLLLKMYTDRLTRDETTSSLSTKRSTA